MNTYHFYLPRNVKKWDDGGIHICCCCQPTLNRSQKCTTAPLGLGMVTAASYGQKFETYWDSSVCMRHFGVLLFCQFLSHKRTSVVSRSALLVEWNLCQVASAVDSISNFDLRCVRGYVDHAYCWFRKPFASRSSQAYCVVYFSRKFRPTIWDRPSPSPTLFLLFGRVLVFRFTDCETDEWSKGHFGNFLPPTNLVAVYSVRN